MPSTRTARTGAPPVVPVARAAAGAVLLAAATAMAHDRSVPPFEAALFRRLNRSAGPAEAPIWVVMQLGNGLVALAAPAGVLALGATRRDALRVAIAAGGAWQLAKGVKRIVRRGRPDALLDDVQLRDSRPSGDGFVSGHATVAAATATVLSPMVGTRSRAALTTLAALVGLARVHVGAHLPLDVVGGAGLGLIWGAACSAVARDVGRAR